MTDAPRRDRGESAPGGGGNREVRGGGRDEARRCVVGIGEKKEQFLGGKSPWGPFIYLAGVLLFGVTGRASTQRNKDYLPSYRLNENTSKIVSMSYEKARKKA